MKNIKRLFICLVNLALIAFYIEESERFIVLDFLFFGYLGERPKAERVLAEYEDFLSLSDPTDRPDRPDPTDSTRPDPTVTLFSVLYLLNQATD